MGTTKHFFIQNIEVLGLVFSEKGIFFYNFSFVSRLEPYVAMETTLLIQSAPKPHVVNSPSEGSHKILT